MVDFLRLVTTHFSFLHEEYGFSIKLIKTVPEFFEDTLIRYETSKVGMNITLDRYEVFIHVGPLTKQEDVWFDICDVINYFGPKLKFAYETPQDLVGEESVSKQLERLAKYVREYCTPILKGNLTMEKEIFAVQEARVRKWKEEMKAKYKQLKNLDW